MPGQLYIVAAPSGAGKTTLVQGLLKRDPALVLSVSYTTRAPRVGEKAGDAYHFVDRETFDAMRERGEFLEYAMVHDNYYGTSRLWIQEQMKAGRDVLLEIDWQGARQVRLHFPQALGVYVLPPSWEELERRLRGRGSDSEEVIRRRLDAALDEMRHVDEFDFVVINNDLETAEHDLVAVVRASRMRLSVQKARQPDFFDFLLSKA